MWQNKVGRARGTPPYSDASPAPLISAGYVVEESESLHTAETYSPCPLCGLLELTSLLAPSPGNPVATPCALCREVRS